MDEIFRMSPPTFSVVTEVPLKLTQRLELSQCELTIKQLAVTFRYLFVAIPGSDPQMSSELWNEFDSCVEDLTYVVNTTLAEIPVDLLMARTFVKYGDWIMSLCVQVSEQLKVNRTWNTNERAFLGRFKTDVIRLAYTLSTGLNLHMKFRSRLQRLGQFAGSGLLRCYDRLYRPLERFKKAITCSQEIPTIDELPTDRIAGRPSPEPN